MDRVTHLVKGVQTTPLNLNYHEWEVTIHGVPDQKLIDHVGCCQHVDRNLWSCAKPTNYWIMTARKLEEVMFTQVQLVAESGYHKGCNCTINLEN
jgi:hypothetical protein